MDMEKEQVFKSDACKKKQPLKNHENICVFYKKQPTYNPQGLIYLGKETRQGSRITDNVGGGTRNPSYFQEWTNYPKSVQEFKSEGKTVHPTQKPVELFEYLIKTYTNEGEIVLDNCIGSGTTAVAAVRTNRNFIGFELEPDYVQIANQRLENVSDEIAERKLTEGNDAK